MTQYLARDLINRLKGADFVEVRIRGDHHIFKNMKSGQSVSIPYSRRKDTIAPGTAHQIIDIIEKSNKMIN